MSHNIFEVLITLPTSKEPFVNRDLLAKSVADKFNTLCEVSFIMGHPVEVTLIPSNISSGVRDEIDGYVRGMLA